MIYSYFDDDFDEDKREMIIDEYSSEIDGVLKSFCNAVLYCVKNNCAQYICCQLFFSILFKSRILS